MKKRILIILLPCMLLSGCDSSEPVGEYKTSYSWEINEADKEDAQKRADTAAEIESGEIFDSIQELCPGAKLTRIEPDQLSVYLEDVDNVISAIENICENCNLESEYFYIAFFIREHGSVLAMLTLEQFKSATSFRSTFFPISSKSGALEAEYKDSTLCKE